MATHVEKTRRELQETRAALRRMEARRREIADRPLRDESRRLRFLRRMDTEIEAARNRLIVAEAEHERAQALAAREWRKDLK